MVQRTPPYKRQTPTNYPELLGVWLEMYADLRQSYGKSRSLEIIGQRHGVSRICVYSHLFPAYKESQKERETRTWAYEKSVDAIHGRIIRYKRHYQNLRNHLPDHVKSAYSEPDQALTLEQISDSILQSSGVAMAPSTIEGILNSWGGKSLLQQCPNTHPPAYRLSPGAGSYGTSP